MRLTGEEREALRAKVDAARRAHSPKDDPGLVDLPVPGTRTMRSNGRGLTQPVRVTHGTEVAYRNYGCRCVDCRAASATARARRRKHPNVKVHSRAGYANGCRCDVCREGNRVYSREFYRAKKAAA